MSTPSLPQTNPDAILRDFFDEPITVGIPLIIRTTRGTVTVTPAEIFEDEGRIYVRMDDDSVYLAATLHVTAMRAIDGRVS